VRRLLVHELPNALPPYLTIVGLGSAALLGGAPIVETVFTWPGVGRFTVEAITARDMPVVTGFTIIAVLVYVVVSLLTDLLTAAVDPRLRPPPGRAARRPAPVASAGGAA
jgi:ABC-type dipeptide/oligopeptide/nickel transport system permease component